MNEQQPQEAELSLPCKFEIEVLEIFGTKPTGEKDECGYDIMIADHDARRFRARLTAFPNGSPDIATARIKVFESAQFKTGEDSKRLCAWRSMYDMISHAVASALLPKDKQPQYKLEETETGIKLTAIQ